MVEILALMKKQKTTEQKKEKIVRIDMAKVRRHLKKVERIIKDKAAFITGEREELFEKIANPKGEIAQLIMLIEEAENHKNEELGKALLALEYDTRQVLNSIKDENILLNNLEKDAKGADERHILAEIEEELAFIMHVEHQMTLLESVGAMSAKALNLLKDEKDLAWKEKAGSNLMNLNNITAFLNGMIMQQEMPQLQNAYNMLQVSDLPEAQEKLKIIQNKFKVLKPKSGQPSSL